jgi:protein TonB
MWHNYGIVFIRINVAGAILMFNLKTSIMKTKTKQANIEKHKKIYLQIGFVITLAIVLTAFEWKTYESSRKVFDRTDFGFDDEGFIKITRHEKPTPPPPKRSPVTVIKEVDNDIEVDDVEIFDPETDQAEPVPEFIYTPPEEAEEGQDMDFVLIPEIKPEFPGGMSALMQYLGSKIYFTQMALGAGISGTVHVGFVVEKDGSISSVILKRGLEAGLDEVAMEAIRSMPKWSPGKQRGMPVRVPMVVPIRFILK